MLILALDTSMEACSVCVFDMERDLIVAQRVSFMERGQAEALAPMVQETLAEAGISFSDLGRIAVTTGPGAFTGVRIGLAMARGLGLALTIPVVGLNSLAAIACNETSQGLPIVVAVDARQEEIYIATFSGDGRETSAPALMKLDHAAGLMPSPSCHLLGTGADDLLQSLGEHQHIRSAAGDLPIAANFVRLAAKTTPGDAPPEPLYLRAPDAKPQANLKKKLPDTPGTLVGVAAAQLLADIHRESFSPAWDAAAFHVLLAQPGTAAIVAPNAQGFVVFRKAADEAEILTICTRPAFRQQGMATAMMQSMEQHLTQDGIKSLFIEVAVSNQAALALYASRGFMAAGVRKNYYERVHGAREDALVMRKSF